MVDLETRHRILRDPSYGVNNVYNGRYTRREILEQLLKGFSCREIMEQFGLHRSSMTSHIASLKKATSSNSVPSMLRKMVIKHRGYL